METYNGERLRRQSIGEDKGDIFQDRKGRNITGKGKGDMQYYLARLRKETRYCIGHGTEDILQDPLKGLSGEI